MDTIETIALLEDLEIWFRTIDCNYVLCASDLFADSDTSDNGSTILKRIKERISHNDLAVDELINSFDELIK